MKGRPVPSDLYSYLNADPATYEVCVNGQPVSAVEQDGYFSIDRTWTPGDVSRISFAMPHPAGNLTPASEANRGRVALERGPLLYAAEGVDNGTIRDLVLPDSAALVAIEHPNLLGGVVTIEGEARAADGQPRPFVAIPYYAWSHRRDGSVVPALRELAARAGPAPAWDQKRVNQSSG